MTIHTVQHKNGLDLTEMRAPSFNERLGGWISSNWKWALAGLVAAGYLSLPASNARVDTLAAKVDSGQQAVAQQNAANEKRFDNIDGILLRIETKLDGLIQAHVPSIPPPTPPRKTATTRKSDNGLLSLFSPKR
jgi:hypothetical protein